LGGRGKSNVQENLKIRGVKGVLRKKAKGDPEKFCGPDKHLSRTGGKRKQKPPHPGVDQTGPGQVKRPGIQNYHFMPSARNRSQPQFTPNNSG